MQSCSQPSKSNVLIPTEQQGSDKQNTFTEWMNFDEKIVSGSADNSELIWMLGQFPHFV